MVFSANDRVLIKVPRQEKWYGVNSADLNPEPGRLPDMGEAAGACVSQPD